MKNKSLIAVSLIVSILVSCKKEHDTLSGKIVPLIQSVTLRTTNIDNDSVISFSEYQYDQNNRIASVKTTTNGIETRLTRYNYHNGGIIESISEPLTDPEGVADTTIYTLNNKGEAVNELYIQPHSYREFSRIFDDSGFIVESHVKITDRIISGLPPYETTSFFTIENNNIMSARVEYPGGTSYIFYDYYTDKSNTVARENMGITFLGKASSNPVMETRFSHASYIIQNSYQFDEKNRIVRNDFSGPGTIPAIITYKYVE